MPYRWFLVWNVLASVAWTGLVLSAGYYLGRHASSLVADVGLLVTVAVLAAALLWRLTRARRAGPAPRRGESRK